MGGRIWILGSGPSLWDTPLEALRGEETFAMNKIHLVYPYTDWRPTKYFKVDYNSVDRMVWKTEILRHVDLGIPLYLWEQFETGYPEGHPNHADMPEGVGALDNVTWIKRCERHHYYQANNTAKRPYEWHLPELCTAWTGISTMMQIAVLEGYEEIYLLGCDLGYTKDYTQNHFVPHYTQDKRDKTEMDNRNMLAAHEVAKTSCPIPVYNAAPGGYLEVWPRVDMREVLRDHKPQKAV